LWYEADHSPADVTENALVAPEKVSAGQHNATAEKSSRVAKQIQNCERQSALTGTALAHQTKEFSRFDLQPDATEDAGPPWIIDRKIDGE
jgi:hypothetical protein